MKKILILLILFINTASYCLPINNLIQTKDNLNDYSGKSDFEIFGLNSSYDQQFFYVCVMTNLPKTGVFGNDSYVYNTNFSPGDLHIKINDNIFGLATTTHNNIVQQAYKNEVWNNIVEGNLYSNAVFADGTFEKYQQLISNEDPDDMDGNDKINSYPTLIKNGSIMNNSGSSVSYNLVSGMDWKYEICYQFALDSIGIKNNDIITFSWAMEYGNDAVKQERVFSNVVPEPATLGMMCFGLMAFLKKRKKY